MVGEIDSWPVTLLLIIEGPLLKLGGGEGGGVLAPCFRSSKGLRFSTLSPLRLGRHSPVMIYIGTSIDDGVSLGVLLAVQWTG